MVNAAKPTLAELLREIRGAVNDFPAFLTPPPDGSWHPHSGWATSAEVGCSLPGDMLLPHAHFKATRAITIKDPPDAVWPWLVQAG
jgi:hypothetical protein